MDTLRAVIFIFICLAFSGSAFAGDRFTYDSYSSSVAKCAAKHDTWISPCALVSNVCPATKDGGSCNEQATGRFLSIDKVTQSNDSASIQFNYCSDAFPTWNGTTCVKDDPCKSKSGQALGRESIWMFLETAPTANTVCIDGCNHQAKGVVCAPKYGKAPGVGDVLQVSTGEACEAQGPFTNKGYKCSSGVPGAGSPYADPPKPYYDNGKGIADCAASGGAWGEINGVGKCVKGLTNGTSGAGVNGTTTKTSTDTKTNADGSKVETKTTTETTCKDGVCTTTITTVTETTGTTGTKTTDTKTGAESKDQNSFCLQNPEHQLCIKSDMSGDCSAGFTCSGDPVQCATAKAAQEMKCTLSGKTDGSTLADQMIAGNDPALQGDNNPLIPKSVTLSSITPSRTLSGACPPPITVTVFGKTASYSFDTVCPWIETLGRILVGLAWLSAFYIIARSIQ